MMSFLNAVNDIYPFIANTTLLIFSLNSLLSWFGLSASGKAEQTWVHTAYSNGVTTVSVIEDVKSNYRRNVYLTVINGKTEYGFFELDDIKQDKTYTYLTGQFMDTCTGTITIRRPNRKSGLEIAAQVTWVVTRQPVNFRNITPKRSCETPKGQVFQATLPEALPKPDSWGEFTNTTSTTFFSDGDYSTWPQWQVVSSDGALHCRDQPHGIVKQTYRKGQVIASMGRQATSLVEMPRSSFWLRTRDRCYVRANKQFLQPVPLPTNRP